MDVKVQSGSLYAILFKNSKQLLSGLWCLLGWMLQRSRLSSPASERREGLCMLQTWVQAPSQLQSRVSLSMWLPWSNFPIIKWPQAALLWITGK